MVTWLRDARCWSRSLKTESGEILRVESSTGDVSPHETSPERSEYPRELGDRALPSLESLSNTSWSTSLGTFSRFGGELVDGTPWSFWTRQRNGDALILPNSCGHERPVRLFVQPSRLTAVSWGGRILELMILR